MEFIYFFYELSYHFMNNGTSVFITSINGIGKIWKIVKTFQSKFVTEIINFGDLKIFENAITNTNITIFEKKISK